MKSALEKTLSGICDLPLKLGSQACLWMTAPQSRHVLKLVINWLSLWRPLKSIAEDVLSYVTIATFILIFFLTLHCWWWGAVGWGVISSSYLVMDLLLPNYLAPSSRSSCWWTLDDKSKYYSSPESVGHWFCNIDRQSSISSWIAHRRLEEELRLRILHGEAGPLSNTSFTNHCNVPRLF